MFKEELEVKNFRGEVGDEEELEEDLDEEEEEEDDDDAI